VSPQGAHASKPSFWTIFDFVKSRPLLGASGAALAAAILLWVRAVWGEDGVSTSICRVFEAGGQRGWDAEYGPVDARANVERLDLEKELLEERLVITERAAKLNVPMDLFPAEQVRGPLSAT
jgi:hypothetical protein